NLINSHSLHIISSFFFLYHSRPHQDLHSFPTRRSSDLSRVDNTIYLRKDLKPEKKQELLAHEQSHAVMYGIEKYLLGRRPLFSLDRKSTRLNSSHLVISYAVFCLKKKKKKNEYYTVQSK